MVVAQTAEPLALPLARACSLPGEGPSCMTLSCLCGRALLVLISLRLVQFVLSNSVRIKGDILCLSGRVLSPLPQCHSVC